MMLFPSKKEAELRVMMKQSILFCVDEIKNEIEMTPPAEEALQYATAISILCEAYRKL